MEEKIILDIFAKRFTELINEHGNIPLLMQELGLKSKSTIYRYMNANMCPKLTTVKIIANIYNVNPVWLMGYEAPKKQISNSNSSVILVYGTIPAGIPIECIEDIIDTQEISADMLRGEKQYFGLKVKGDSMNPNYLSGDILIVLKQDDCENGDDCIVMVNGNDGTFKRIFKDEKQNTITLQPLNTSKDENGKLLYEPITFTNEQILKLPVKILGKVVEIRRKI